MVCKKRRVCRHNSIKTDLFFLMELFILALEKVKVVCYH